MAYNDFELSIDASQPDELFDFHYIGDGSHYRITSSAFDVPHDGFDYAAIPLQRSDIKRTSEVGKNNLTVRMDRNNSYFQRYIASPLTYDTNLTLYSLQPDGSFVVIWIGIVMSVRKTAKELEVVVSPISTSANRPILHRKYQIQCPHALYGYHCGINRAVNSRTGTITAITGDVVESTTFGLEDDGWFTGGVIQVGSEEKTIVKHVGDFVTLLDPFYGVEAGDSFSASAGCDHSLATCDSKFANSLNYGGYPWIPSDDIITKGKPFTY